MAVAVLLPWTVATAQAPTPHTPEKHDHAHDDAAERHVHAPVPNEYKTAHIPSAAWTNERLLARGKEIYATNCAVCHGEQGGGDGPAAAGLPLKPPSFREARMVNEMAGNYWFWRVSEGGLVEPFRSMGSVMPAWKAQLSVEERWAVIAYTHRFSGHDGAHVTSEHPQMLMDHGAHGTAGGTAPKTSAPPAHKH